MAQAVKWGKYCFLKEDLQVLFGNLKRYTFCYSFAHTFLINAFANSQLICRYTSDETFKIHVFQYFKLRKKEEVYGKLACLFSESCFWGAIFRFWFLSRRFSQFMTWILFSQSYEVDKNLPLFHRPEQLELHPERWRSQRKAPALLSRQGVLRRQSNGLRPPASFRNVVCPASQSVPVPRKWPFRGPRAAHLLSKLCPGLSACSRSMGNCR